MKSFMQPGSSFETWFDPMTSVYGRLGVWLMSGIEPEKQMKGRCGFRLKASGFGTY